jgi:threonine/homoserine/homoserine lactone efflux protein
MGSNVGLVASAFALGATLGLLPGPVQFLLLTEASRGGVRRGFSAMAGANGMFGVLLLAFAAGTAILAPDLTVLRILKVVGGLFLLYLGADALQASIRAAGDGSEVGAGRIPVLRGVFAVLLNPGAWVFLATTASSLFATAARSGGRPLALATALVMLCGIAAVDGPMVLLGGGVRRFEQRLARWLVPVLAAALIGFGVLLVVQGLRG